MRPPAVGQSPGRLCSGAGHGRGAGTHASRRVRRPSVKSAPRVRGPSVNQTCSRQDGRAEPGHDPPPGDGARTGTGEPPGSSTPTRVPSLQPPHKKTINQWSDEQRKGARKLVLKTSETRHLLPPHRLILGLRTTVWKQFVSIRPDSKTSLNLCFALNSSVPLPSPTQDLRASAEPPRIPTALMRSIPGELRVFKKCTEKQNPQNSKTSSMESFSSNSWFTK